MWLHARRRHCGMAGVMQLAMLCGIAIASSDELAAALHGDQGGHATPK